MASIKYLKKQIKSLTEALKDECLISLAIHPDIKPESITSIYTAIDDIGKELIFSINHCQYKPTELSARQYINISVAEAEKKLDVLLDKVRKNVK